MGKAVKFEQYQDMLARLYPEFGQEDGGDNNEKNSHRFLTRTVTFMVTDSCNLACKYCYEIHKGKRRMTFDTAKKFVDLLLSGEKGFKEYVSPDYSLGIILEFIGGEPFLEIELIDKICDYFYRRVLELQHPWADHWMISICSNGVLYRDPKVQAFLNKWKNRLSFSITIDGNKELHDSCRVFPDGSPSYDIAWDGVQDWVSKGNYMGSKITIAPGNIEYLYDALTHIVECGYTEINANCVYEEGWTNEHATEFYNQLKRVADYFIDNDLVESHYLALFVESFFKPKSNDDLQNWCGGNGMMLSVDPDGKLFPCIRYMETSLGGQQEPYSIGDLETGIGKSCLHCNRIDCLNKIDRRTQSTDECFDCPIAEGCSWCTAYNYQVNGTPDSRATYICCMHKARALANAYFWSRWYTKTNQDKKYELYVPKEWALDIISEEEWNYLTTLPNVVVKETEGDYYENYIKR